MAITMKEAIQLWLEHEHKAHAHKDVRAMSTSTLALMRALVAGGRLKPVEHIQIDHLTPTMIENLRSGLIEAGLSDSYTRRHLDVISGASHFAWQRDYAKSDPMQFWRARKRTRRTKATRAADEHSIETLTKDEVGALLDEAESRKLKVYPAILLAAGSGLRLGEIRALRWKHVADYECSAATRILHICESWPSRGTLGEVTKTGQSRFVLYPERFRTFVSRRRDIDDALVLGNSDPKNLLTSLVKVAQQAGITSTVNWLTLRHTFASQLLTNGFPLDWIAAQLGNSPMICRKHYATFIDPWRAPVAIPEDRNPMDTIF